jgi:hypothetical protein
LPQKLFQKQYASSFDSVVFSRSSGVAAVAAVAAVEAAAAMLT